MRMNKKKIVAVGLTCALASALLVGNVEYASHSFAVAKAATNGIISAAKKVDEISENQTKVSAVEKNESVYVTLDASGNKTDVVVSDWLKNSGIGGTLEDSSNLTDIQNTKGEEAFEQDGDKLTWQTGDKDIYYQGKTQEELPVQVEISYKLDGEEIQPKDLIGKSGKLEMTIHYKNLSKKTVTIGGEEREIYTPFLMATGMILPVEHFSNVTVDNGEVMSEGDNDIVAVYGMPGLKESLDLDSLEFGEDADIDTGKISDKMTDTSVITADVTEFQLGPTYTVATASLFRDIDFDDVSEPDELDDKMDELKDAANDLVDGSDQIQDGLDELDSSFVKYSKAIKTLQKSVKKLNSGSKQIKGATDKYTNSTDKLLTAVNTYVTGTKTFAKSTKTYTAGTKQLVAGVGKLYDGSKAFPESYQTFHDSLNAYVAGVDTLLSEENMTKLSNGSAALKAGIDQINAGASALDENRENVDTAIAGLEKLQKQYMTMAEAETDDTKKATYTAMAEKMAEAVAGTKAYIVGAENLATSINAATNGKDDGELDQNGSADLASGMATLDKSLQAVAENAKTLRDNSSKLTGASATINESVESICSNLKTIYQSGQLITGNNKKLDEAADTLIKNADAVKKNSKKLKGSSGDFRKAAKTLASGTGKLLSGVNTLTGKTGDVSRGIGKLANGSIELYDGMKEFKKEGVKKLTDTVDDLLNGTSDLKDTITEIDNAAKEYKSFSGIAQGMDGKVKFVMTTEELKPED